MRDSCRPSYAEEGLTGLLIHDNNGALIEVEDITSDEMLDLDSEGRCVITQHSIQGRFDFLKPIQRKPLQSQIF